MFYFPDTMFPIIIWIVWISLTIIFYQLVFYTVLSLFGVKAPKRDYQFVEDKKTFLFMIPAHNEENVIAQCIESLLALNYKKDLYDIVCIVDNCTDGTLEVVESYPVKCFINTTPAGDPRGKPHAIAAYFNNNKKTWHDYDYVVFVDADNILDSEYLREINSQLYTHPDFIVVQGYLDSKNVTSSLISQGYASAYFIVNRSLQYAKYCLGWNAAIGGTGFVLQVDYLKRYAWNPRSYTEDFELQVELSIRGKKSGWNHFAKTYDEKPNSLIASHRQRTRWSQGHWYVAITTTAKQITSIVKSKSLVECMSRVETLVYSYSMIRPIYMILICALALMDRRFALYIPALYSTLLFWVVIQSYNYLIIPIGFLLSESKRVLIRCNTFTQRVTLVISLLFCYILNGIIYTFAKIHGFLTFFLPQNSWKKTEHNEVIER